MRDSYNLCQKTKKKIKKITCGKILLSIMEYIYGTHNLTI